MHSHIHLQHPNPNTSSNTNTNTRSLEMASEPVTHTEDQYLHVPIEKLPIKAALRKQCKRMGYKEARPVQAACIPPTIKGTSTRCLRECVCVCVPVCAYLCVHVCMSAFVSVCGCVAGSFLPLSPSLWEDGRAQDTAGFRQREGRKGWKLERPELSHCCTLYTHARVILLALVLCTCILCKPFLTLACLRFACVCV